MAHMAPGTYPCYESVIDDAPVVSRFIDNATLMPVGVGDTHVSLCLEGTTFVLRARCDFGPDAPADDDELCLFFDPVGREADLVELHIRLDGGTAAFAVGTCMPRQDPAWLLEPYALNYTAGVTRGERSWQVDFRARLDDMFPEHVPAAFRFNIGRNRANRVWSFWPLAPDTYGEFMPHFARVQIRQGPPNGTHPILATRKQPPLDAAQGLPFVGLMYDTSRAAIRYDTDTYVHLAHFLGRAGGTAMMLYFEDGFRYRSHPEFAHEKALDAEDVRTIARACRAHGLDLVLAQTTLGHMHDVLRHPAYRHLSENDDPYQICPTHPETRPFLKDLLDELIPLTDSPYFNINCDESRHLGQCPRCRRQAGGPLGQERLFLEHILWLNDLVRSHGKRTMIWHDMLLGMPSIIPEVPRDMTVLAWHYTDWHTFPTLRHFQDLGFETMAVPGARLASARKCALDAIRYRAAGSLQTIWESPDPLGSRAGSIYLHARTATGRGGARRNDVLADLERMLWPETQPRLPWELVMDRRSSTPAEQLRQNARDSLTKLDACAPAAEFEWIHTHLAEFFSRWC